ncbi:MAG: hypothetical protein K1X54_06520 [Flavobacteriales bacterium]|nr:hypothetical protein [Flavobacteriales bacterium]
MNARKSFLVALLNLALLAIVGFILRYKIVFSLPWVDQKHLLHAHSHFAFSGWIAQALMVMIAHVSGAFSDQQHERTFKRLLYTNLIAAYGMLIAFTIQGYGAVSITFSTLAIVVLIYYTIYYFKTSDKLFRKSPPGELISAGLCFGILSSLGAFALGFMMMMKMSDERLYLIAIYFFLHFQYNGFFLLTCIGIFLRLLHNAGIQFSQLVMMCRLLIISVIPAFFLSVLWLKLPALLYTIIVCSAILQAYVLGLMIYSGFRQRQLLRTTFQPATQTILTLATLALIIKLALQLGSTIPALSTWAYGYRPIIIGYLHLVLLGIITLSMIAAAIHWQWIPIHPITRSGLILFISGLILNELGLLVQGISAIVLFDATSVGYWLLFAAFLMMTGILTMWIGSRSNPHQVFR